MPPDLGMLLCHLGAQCSSSCRTPGQARPTECALLESAVGDRHVDTCVSAPGAVDDFHLLSGGKREEAEKAEEPLDDILVEEPFEETQAENQCEETAGKEKAEKKDRTVLYSVCRGQTEVQIGQQSWMGLAHEQLLDVPQPRYARPRRMDRASRME
eukprot:6430804-Amphidinium_carterae.1